MREQKTKLTWLHWIAIGCFLGYLAFVSGGFDGNSLLIGSVGIICIVIGLFQTAWLRQRIWKRANVIEIDLAEDECDEKKHDN